LRQIFVRSMLDSGERLCGEHTSALTSDTSSLSDCLLWIIALREALLAEAAWETTQAMIDKQKLGFYRRRNPTTTLLVTYLLHLYESQ
jgi:hypothetical protein